MNQGGALVHLYTDGTVLVSHGGTEMGQGLHTKVCQVAAQAFGIPVENVYVNDSSTDKVANTIPTAASMSTDLYGMATLDACRQILRRLEPFAEILGPSATLSAIAKEAFMARVDLSAHGFFTVDTIRCGFDWLKEKPDDFADDLPENSWKGHPVSLWMITTLQVSNSNTSSRDAVQLFYTGCCNDRSRGGYTDRKPSDAPLRRFG